MAYTERYVTSGAGGGGDGSSGTPWTLAEAIANAAAGDRVNIQSDATYTLTGSITFPNGSSGSPIVWRGYNSTIGDLETVGRSSATSALDTTNFPLIDGGSSYFVTFGTYNNAINLRITSGRNGATAAGVNHFSPWRCSFVNTHTTGNSSSALSMGSTNYSSCVDCDAVIASNNSNANGLLAGRGGVCGCRVWNSGTPGATQAGINLEVMTSAHRNIVFNFGYAIRCSQYSHLVQQNTLYDCGYGVVFGGASTACVGNVIYSMTSYAFGTTSANAILLISNACGALTSGRLDSGLGSTIEEIDAISLTGDPFTNSGSEDFTLNNTAGAGAACRAASQLWDGYADLGAVQHQDSGGGGIGSLIGMGGGLIGKAF